MVKNSLWGVPETRRDRTQAFSLLNRDQVPSDSISHRSERFNARIRVLGSLYATSEPMFTIRQQIQRVFHFFRNILIPESY